MISTQNLLLLLKNEFRLKGRLYILITSVWFIMIIFLFFNSSLSITDLFTSNTSFTNFNPGANTFAQFESHKFHLIWYPQVFLIVTSIFTSLSFSEYAENSQRNLYLSLPATQLEKWLAKLIIALIILPAIFIILYQIFAFLTYRWDNYISIEQVKLTLADSFLWTETKKILIFQCFVFFGAILYQRYSFFKTTLLALSIYATYNIIQFLTLSIIREDLSLFGNGNIPGITSIKNATSNAGYYLNQKMFTSPFDLYTNTNFASIYIGLSFIFLMLSYLKFVELET